MLYTPPLKYSILVATGKLSLGEDILQYNAYHYVQLLVDIIHGLTYSRL